jgi:hypothetical protein
VVFQYRVFAHARPRIDLRPPELTGLTEQLDRYFNNCIRALVSASGNADLQLRSDVQAIIDEDVGIQKSLKEKMLIEGVLVFAR